MIRERETARWCGRECGECERERESDEESQCLRVYNKFIVYTDILLRLLRSNCMIYYGLNECVYRMLYKLLVCFLVKNS